MIRVLSLAGLMLVALGANAALLLRGEDKPEPITGETRAVLGGAPVLVPRAFVREPAQWAGGRLERFDLQMRADDFSPLPPRTSLTALQPEPERISLVLTAVQPGSGAAERFQLLYSRFVSAETKNRADGLVTRGFRPGTPYEDREIHIGAGIGRHFYVLCPKGEVARIEPCIAQVTSGPVQAEIRFLAARLNDWKRIGTEMARMLDAWRVAAEPPVAEQKPRG
jgi:hypothetical protein